jgi:hypothetical protein
MCNAIPVAALLTGLLAGLTLLRFARTTSPNAALLTCALSAVARDDGPDEPGAEDAPSCTRPGDMVRSLPSAG